ncbi:MAG: M23 family metallopeptidase [Sphingomonas sp.]
MRRLIVISLVVPAIVIALWLGALFLLPDLPPGAGKTLAGEVSPAGKGADPAPPATMVGDMLGIPIAGIGRAALQDSWGDPRDNGLRAHHGTDIVVPSMTPVIAAAPGKVEKLFNSAKGGITLYVRSPQRDWTYYYAHLAGYAPGLHEGQTVRAGDRLAYVGDTGDAGPGNYHLHFGLTRTARDQHWYEGTDVDPYPYLAGKQPLR